MGKLKRTQYGRTTVEAIPWKRSNVLQLSCKRHVKAFTVEDTSYFVRNCVRYSREAILNQICERRFAAETEDNKKLNYVCAVKDFRSCLFIKLFFCSETATPSEQVFSPAFLLCTLLIAKSGVLFDFFHQYRAYFIMCRSWLISIKQ